MKRGQLTVCRLKLGLATPTNDNLASGPDKSLSQAVSYPRRSSGYQHSVPTKVQLRFISSQPNLFTID
jgi:hypothetical protein